MGYLNKATITVDAILTNRGRELLAQGGRSAFNITKFAVADDEVDYGLYNVAHPEGSEYYGAIIENMPVLEATPDEQQIMRYKLVTLNSTEFGNTFIQNNGEILIPSIDGFTDRTLTSDNTTSTFTVATNPTFTESYTLLVANANLIKVYRGTDVNGTQLNTTAAINANGSITLTFAAGERFTIQRIDGKTGTTSATLFGDRTGATSTITITVS
jgi:hypothetical protein